MPRFSSLACVLALVGCAPETVEQSQMGLTDGDGTSGGADGILEVFFTEPGLAPGEEVDPLLEDALVALLDTAVYSVDMSLYEFDMPPVADAALRAFDRGVQVRMVGDADEAGDAGYAALAAVGIPIQSRKAGDRIMHNKFVVVDNHAVWTGSTNMSHNGVFRNNNNALLIESSSLAMAYTVDFEQMFTHGLFGRHKDDLGDARVVSFHDQDIEAYFSPEHNPVEELVFVLDSAQHSIHFMIFSGTHPDVRDALIRAHDRGVQVVGVFDKSQGYGHYSIDEALALAGVPTYIDGNENASGFSGGKLHHKVALIDAMVPGADARLVTGSFNWSKSATHYNDENLLILSDADIIDAYVEEFCGVFEAANVHADFVGELVQPCTAAVPDVLINEFLPNPSGYDRGQEYVELVNASDYPVDLTGWALGDAITPMRHVFGELVLQPGEVVVVFDEGDHDSVTGAINSTTGHLSLNNTGDALRLSAADGTVVDEAVYSGSRDGVSWTRDVDGYADATWAYHDEISQLPTSPGQRSDGTPFLESVQPQAPAVVIINELMANPAGTDLGQEWLEIVNVGESAAVMDGWVIADGVSERHVFDAYVLAPGDAVIIFDRGDHSDVPGHLLSSSTQLSLNNAGDAISLFDENRELVDIANYGAVSTGVSMNRSADGEVGAEMVPHTEVAPDGSSSSLGYRADGEDW